MIQWVMLVGVHRDCGLIALIDIWDNFIDLAGMVDAHLRPFVDQLAACLKRLDFGDAGKCFAGLGRKVSQHDCACDHHREECAIGHVGRASEHPALADSLPCENVSF
jgi:hypothetical protein